MRAALALLVLAAGCCEEDLEPDLRDPWSEGAMLPVRRLEAAVAPLGAQLVVAGGFTSAQELTGAVDVLDTFNGTWSALPPLPVAWSHGALAASAGTLFLLGGLEGTAFTARGEAFALAPGAADWQAIAPLPPGQERGAAAVVVALPQIILAGGASTTGVLASVLVYSVSSGAWTQLPDLPVPRSHAAAMRLGDGTLIVAGGIGQVGQPLGDVYALRLGGTAWEARTPMPTPRGGCAYGLALGWLVCAGGESGSTALRVVEAYDPIADVWTELPEMPAPRAGAPGAMIGQRLFVPGGAASLAFEPVDTVLIFSAIDALALREAEEEEAEEAKCEEEE